MIKQRINVNVDGDTKNRKARKPIYHHQHLQSRVDNYAFTTPKRDAIMTTFEERIKEEIEGWEESLKLRLVKRISINEELKKQEQYLKKLRSFKYLTDREIKEAKTMIKRTKSKKTRVPREVRKWNLEHLDKAMGL